ncbi:cytochrome c oxidase assembly factor Coa1 family protein [Lysobacter sp. CCNWLW3]|uniref:cytochrome c oxidase assembly factor Coa1 family protein n=1 Tax=unclassified Lysobacter TaxID=2635362 RepID=UPI002FD76EB3
MSATPPPLPQRDWAQRNRLWFLPLLVVLGLALIVGVFGGVFSMVRGQITSHPAYIEAMAKARANPQVVAGLGEPIEAGMFTMGSVVANSEGGHAFLDIPLIGPKAQAELSVVATNDGPGQPWNYMTMAVTMPDGSEISLIATDPPDLSTAPGCDRPSDDSDDT